MGNYIRNGLIAGIASMALSYLAPISAEAQNPPRKEPVLSASWNFVQYLQHSEPIYTHRITLGGRYRPCIFSHVCGSAGVMFGRDDPMTIKPLAGEGQFFHVGAGAEFRIGPLPLWLLPSYGKTSHTFVHQHVGYYDFFAIGAKASVGQTNFVLEKIVHAFSQSINGSSGIHDLRFMLHAPLMALEAGHTSPSPGQPDYSLWTGNFTVGLKNGPFMSGGTRSVPATWHAMENKPEGFEERNIALKYFGVGVRFSLAR